MGRKFGGWVMSGMNCGASDGLMVGWAEVGKWRMVDKWRKCQVGENIDRWEKGWQRGRNDNGR